MYVQLGRKERCKQMTFDMYVESNIELEKRIDTEIQFEK